MTTMSRLINSTGQPTRRIVFLLDVDNTLLDNDHFVSELKGILVRDIGTVYAQRYWDIFEQQRTELGCADYLGALERLRLEDPRGQRLSAIALFLLNYPFGDRVYAGALAVIKHLSTGGQTVILTDGDVVFQPHKIERSALSDAVDGRVLIYVHKERELTDIERVYPADHYVLVDDKLRILNAVKQIWTDRVTTVFVRQGHYAHDPAIISREPLADVSVDAIADLLDIDLPGVESS